MTTRPSTALPKDLTMTFDWPHTGDATKDAVLNDAQRYVRMRASAGKVDVTTPSDKDFYRYDLPLFDDASRGVWRVSKITVAVAAQCKD